MRALVLTAIGELQVRDVPQPRVGAPDQVLVKVGAVGICGSDLHGYTGKTGRRKPPLIMGHEASGVVVEVGDDVRNVFPGMRVAIQPLVAAPDGRRLLGMDLPGAYAEYVVCPAANVRQILDSMSLQEAAMAEPVAVAIHAVDRVAELPRGSALVVGAGPIGLLVAQLARARGWSPVLVSDLIATRRNLAAELGFVPVDSTDGAELLATVADHTSGHGVDVAFEAVGVGPAVAQAHSSLKRNGAAVWVGNNAKLIEVDMQEVVTRELTICGTYGLSAEDFDAALGLIGSRAVEVAPLLSRFAPLEEGPVVFNELLGNLTLVKGMFVVEE